MATMRQRDNGNWFVEIRKKGFPTIRKTVRTKTQAKQFIYRTESLMDEGEWIDPGGFDQTITVPEVLDIYLNELLEDRPGHTIGKSKLSCLNRMKKEPHFIGVSLVDLSPKILNEYSKKRRRKVGPKTLGDDFSFLAAAIDTANVLHSLGLSSNVARDMKKLLSQKGTVGKSKRRVRRITKEEELALYEVTVGDWLHSIIRIAIETGMRQEEIHKLEWQDINFERGIVLIRDRKDPHNKIGNDEEIPLLPAMREVLLREKRWAKTHKVFPYPALTASVSDKFAKKAERAGCPDLTFHDIRHEAVSRLMERGLSIPEVCIISGHKSWDTLKRYTHLKPEAILSKF